MRQSFLNRWFRKIRCNHPDRTLQLRAEFLEDRCNPATLNVTGSGVVTYVGAPGTADNLSISTDGTNYTVNDTAETITLTAGATTAGWTGSGTNTVTGPNASVFTIAVNTANVNNNHVFVTSVSQPITVDTGSGSGNTVTVGGAGVGVQAINSPVQVQSTGGTVALTVDDSGNTSPAFAQLDNNDVFALAPYDITFTPSQLSSLLVKGGSGGNFFVVTDTVSSITTTIDAGTGNNFTDVLGTTGTLTINGQGGADGVSVSNAGNTSGIAGNVSVGNSGGQTFLSIDDSATNVSHNVTITPTRTAGPSTGTVTGMLAGSATVTWAAGSLSVLSVNTGTYTDVFNAAQDQTAQIVLNGGQPTPAPGNTLNLNVVGTLNPIITPTGPASGTVTATGFGELDWYNIATVPIPFGFGGLFDMTPSLSYPVQAGDIAVLPTTTYSALQGYGWTKAPPRGYTGGTAGALSGDPLANLLATGVDGGGVSGLQYASIFRIDLVSNNPMQLTAFLGDYAGARSDLDVSYSLTDPLGSPTYAGWQSFDTNFSTAQNQYVSVSSPPITPLLNGSAYTLWVRVANLGSTAAPNWGLDGLYFRPEGLVSNLVVARQDGAPGTTAQYADGLTVDTYTVTGATPNAVLNVSPQSGTGLNDARSELPGVQVITDASGDATFQIQRPTGAATSTITVSDYTGAAIGTFTQSYQLPEVRRIDFGLNPTSSVSSDVNGQYLGWSTGLYNASSEMGWVTTAPSAPFDRGSVSTITTNAPEQANLSNLIRDGVGSFGASDFEIDVPVDGTYSVTVVMGDLSYARTTEIVQQVSPNGGSILQTLIPSLNTAVGQFSSQTFTITSTSGVIRLRFNDMTQNLSWVVNSLEVRPLPPTGTPGTPPGSSSAPLPTEQQHVLTIAAQSPPTAPPPNGTSSTTFNLTGASPNALVQITTAFGLLTGTNAGTRFAGFTVQTDGSGNGTFTIQAPRTTGSLTGAITATEVTGEGYGSLNETWVGASQFYDMGTASSPTDSATTAKVLGTTTYSAGTGYGWAAAVSMIDRGVTASTPMNDGSTNLYRAFNYASGTATFEVLVGSDTHPTVTIYSFDSGGTNLTKETFQLSGGAVHTRGTNNSTTLSDGTAVNGVLTITVTGVSANWVVNGISVT